MNVSAVSASPAMDAYQELIRRRQEMGADAMDAANTGLPGMAVNTAAQAGTIHQTPLSVESPDAGNREVQTLSDGGMDETGNRRQPARPGELLQALEYDRPAVRDTAERDQEGLYASARQDLAARGMSAAHQGDFVNFMLSRIHTAYGI